jgi:hypothetical protein
MVMKTFGEDLGSRASINFGVKAMQTDLLLLCGFYDFNQKRHFVKLLIRHILFYYTFSVDGNVWFYYGTSDPPRLRIGTMLILLIECFSTILCMLYTFKPSS